jgi:hypothetical protein
MPTATSPTAAQGEPAEADRPSAKLKRLADEQLADNVVVEEARKRIKVRHEEMQNVVAAISGSVTDDGRATKAAAATTTATDRPETDDSKYF